MSKELTVQLLRVSGSAYAGFAAGTLIEGGSNIETANEPGAFDLWKSHFEQRLGELTTALTFDRPELFAAGVRWTRDAFAARGMPEADLGAGLDALEEVLGSELPPGSADTLLPYLAAARDALADATDNESPLELTNDASRAALEYIAAVLEGDSRKAIARLESAVEGGMEVVEVCERILVPAQLEIGRLWHNGEIGVAEEHFATITTQRALTILFHQAEVKPRNGLTALIACSAGNTHDLALRMLAEQFEVEGWRAILLGGDMPAGDLLEAIAHHQPSVLVLSAALSQHLLALRDTIAAIRASEDPFAAIPVLVGGKALSVSAGLWRQLGADGWAPSLLEAVEEASRLARQN